MAVPKRKLSKARTRRRRATWRLAVPTLVACPRCKALNPSHQVCANCGFYAGREVRSVE